MPDGRAPKHKPALSPHKTLAPFPFARVSTYRFAQGQAAPTRTYRSPCTAHLSFLSLFVARVLQSRYRTLAFPGPCAPPYHRPLPRPGYLLAPVFASREAEPPLVRLGARAGGRPRRGFWRGASCGLRHPGVHCRWRARRSASARARTLANDAG